MASELTQQTTDAAIAAVRNKARKQTMPYNGACYYCGEKLHSPLVFCDAQCRDDYVYERERHSINRK